MITFFDMKYPIIIKCQKIPKLLYEIFSDSEDLNIDPITSNEIYMRNGIAMIDPNAVEVLSKRNLYN